jgi:hypothetical protein
VYLTGPVRMERQKCEEIRKGLGCQRSRVWGRSALAILGLQQGVHQRRASEPGAARLSLAKVAEVSVELATMGSIGSTVKGFEVYYPAALALKGYWLGDLKL